MKVNQNWARLCLLIMALSLSMVGCGKGLLDDDENTDRRNGNLTKNQEGLKPGDDVSKEKNLRAKILEVDLLKSVYADSTAYVQANLKKTINELNVNATRCTIRNKDLTVGEWPSARVKDDSLIFEFLNQATDSVGVNHIYLGIMYYPSMQIVCSKSKAGLFTMAELNAVMGKSLEFYIP